MDILKKAVLLVAILSIAVFMPGCGGDDDAPADAETGAAGAAEAAEQLDSTTSDNMDELKKKIEEAQQ